MVSTASLLPALLAAVAAASVQADLPYTLGKPTFFGSGCPKDTVAVVSSTDGTTISVLFSEFASSTTSSRWRQYKSCSLAVPLDVKAGTTVAISQVDYRGNVFVPNDPGSHADFTAEYFLVADQGPQYTRTFTSGFSGNVLLSDPVAVVKWSPCGASSILRVNANLIAQKTAANNSDVQIAIDSADTKLGGFRYKIVSKQC